MTIRKCLLLQRGVRLQTSESDVYRRQILKSEVDSRTVRVNPLSAESRFYSFLSILYYHLKCQIYTDLQGNEA